MNRLEFLHGLKTELEGKVPNSVIQENLRYYESYISEEVKKGNSESEVIEALGSPRLIARTIVDAAYNVQDRTDGYDTYGSGKAQDASSESYEQDSFDQQREDFGKNFHYIDFGRWPVRLAAGVIIFLLLYLFMSIAWGILGIAGALVYYLWPFLLIVFVIWFLFGNGRH